MEQGESPLNSVKIRANAKVNLWLDITGKRPDGYHTLRTVMLSVGIADTVSVARRESGISISCNDAGVPIGERNIAYQAAAAFLTRTGLSGGAEIKIEKNINKTISKLKNKVIIFCRLFNWCKH